MPYVTQKPFTSPATKRRLSALICCLYLAIVSSELCSESLAQEKWHRAPPRLPATK